MTSKGRSSGNHLVDALPRAEQGWLMDASELVSLPQEHLLYDLNDQIDFVYFPVSCAVSLITVMDTGATVEAAVVASEGMLGLSLFFDVDSAFARTIVQVEGNALRIKAKTFKDQKQNTPHLSILLSQYTQVLYRQTFISTGCNHFHSVEQRIARWLLTHEDRVGGRTFPFTHALLADMIGVHRSTVTGVTDTLQKANILKQTRGRITVLNQQALVRISCQCYGATKEVLDSFIARLHDP